MRRIVKQFDFDLGDAVFIDGLSDKKGFVTAAMWRSEEAQYEVCWWNEASHVSAWFSTWRLSLADTTPKIYGFGSGDRA